MVIIIEICMVVFFSNSNFIFLLNDVDVVEYVFK